MSIIKRFGEIGFTPLYFGVFQSLFERFIQRGSQLNPLSVDGMEKTAAKAVERLINANVDLDSAGLSPYESGYVNGYNDALVNLLNALNIEHDFHHFD